MFGAVLLAVVAIAVTVIAPIGGSSIGAAMANAALGSLASQAVGVATGIQEKFNFKAVAMAGIAGGVGAYLQGLGSAATAAGEAGKQLTTLGKIGQFLGKNALLSNAARGALSSAITQGIGVATGLQSKFDFAGVAAAGVGAMAGGALGRRLSGNPASFANTLATSTASALANAATRSAIESSSFGANVIAAIPDVIGQAIGNAIGGAVGGRIARAGEPENLIPDAFYAPVQQPGAQIAADPVANNGGADTQGEAAAR